MISTRYEVVLAPMRVQPFHYGHALYLHQLANLADKVVVLLHTIYGDEDNPFPFTQRRRWVVDYVQGVELNNTAVPERLLSLSSGEEYRLLAERDNFVVFTTDVTHDRYSSQGFLVHNHERFPLLTPVNIPEYLSRYKTEFGMGTKIRRLLREGKTCIEYMPQQVMSEASKWLHP